MKYVLVFLILFSGIVCFADPKESDPKKNIVGHAVDHPDHIPHSRDLIKKGIQTGVFLNRKRKRV